MQFINFSSKYYKNARKSGAKINKAGKLIGYFLFTSQFLISRYFNKLEEEDENKKKQHKLL